MSESYLTDTTRPKPALHASDPVFIRISSAHPMQEIQDGPAHKVRYRAFEKDKTGDAIIFLPGMFETCSSPLYLLDQIAQGGYRCYSVDLVGYDTYSEYVRGLVKFCRREEISKIHLIGSDTGGFDAIEFASFPHLGRNIAIMSITLINSFREPKIWEQSSVKFKVFGKLAAKGILLDKIEKSGALDQGLRASVFCAHEVETMSGSDIAARLKRMVSSRFPIAPALESERILSIEPSDRSMPIPDDQVPSNAIKNITVETLSKGGDWPHIEVSHDVSELILAHLQKWAVDVPLIEGQEEDAA